MTSQQKWYWALDNLLACLR